MVFDALLRYRLRSRTLRPMDGVADRGADGGAQQGVERDDVERGFCELDQYRVGEVDAALENGFEAELSAGRGHRPQ